MCHHRCSRRNTRTSGKSHHRPFQRVQRQSRRRTHQRDTRSRKAHHCALQIPSYHRVRGRTAQDHKRKNPPRRNPPKRQTLKKQYLPNKLGLYHIWHSPFLISQYYKNYNVTFTALLATFTIYIPPESIAIRSVLPVADIVCNRTPSIL